MNVETQEAGSTEFPQPLLEITGLDNNSNCLTNSFLEQQYGLSYQKVSNKEIQILAVEINISKETGDIKHEELRQRK